MAFKIEIAPLAKLDLIKIFDYLILNVSSEYAKKIEKALKNTSSKICKEPKLYKIAEESRLANQNIRKAPIEGYLIYYKVNESKNLIIIGRIRSDKQNNRNIKV